MNVHEFLNYRMEKVAKSSVEFTPLSKKNRKKMKKSFGRFKQGVGDMIMLPSYAEGVIEGGKRGAKIGAGAGAGLTGAAAALIGAGGKYGVGPGITAGESAYAIGVNAARGGVIGGQAGALLGANKVRLRRKLARSRRMKALAALGVGGAGYAANAMRKK